MDRRSFLAGGLLTLASIGTRGASGEIVRDRHTRLDSAVPARIVRPGTVEEVQAAVRAGGVLCPAGRLHSSGGQALLDGGTLLDMTGLDRVRSVDLDRGEATVEAGAQWPAVVSFLRRNAPAWTIRQKQTIATLTLGGTVSANSHGNAVGLAPIAGDVSWIELVDAAGIVRRCDRSLDPMMFRAALGGFGLVGVLTTIGLRLQPRIRVRFLMDVVRAEDVAERMERLQREGVRYGSCAFPCDAASPDFLGRGLMLYHVPDARGPVEPSPPPMSPAAWISVMRLLHGSPAEAWAVMYAAWLEAAGRTWWVDDVLMQDAYVDGYHRELDGGGGSDVMIEFVLPPPQFAPFVSRLRQRVRERRLRLLLCEVRRVEGDTDSLLAYAPRTAITVVIAVHVEPATLRLAQDELGGALDDALMLGGSFQPAFSWCATPQRLAKALPGLEQWRAVKRAVDPDGRFRSQWYERRLGSPG